MLIGTVNADLARLARDFLGGKTHARRVSRRPGGSAAASWRALLADRPRNAKRC